jgi:hypothetical protein
MENEDQDYLKELLEKYSVSEIVDHMANNYLTIANNLIDNEDYDKQKLYSRALEILEEAFHDLEDLGL